MPGEASESGHAGGESFQNLRDSVRDWLTGTLEQSNSKPALPHRSSSDKQRGRNGYARRSVSGQMHASKDGRDQTDNLQAPKPGAMPRPVGGSAKLGTFNGVFVPTTLNVLSILMFIRFGMILGQSGLLGMLGMLLASYLINLVTTLSISAIATNGTVRGGGAYYLISRSLGPEFGGSIGIVLYLGTLLLRSIRLDSKRFNRLRLQHWHECSRPSRLPKAKLWFSRWQLGSFLERRPLVGISLGYCRSHYLYDHMSRWERHIRKSQQWASGPPLGINLQYPLLDFGDASFSRTEAWHSLHGLPR